MRQAPCLCSGYYDILSKQKLSEFSLYVLLLMLEILNLLVCQKQFDLSYSILTILAWYGISYRNQSFDLQIK